MSIAGAKKAVKTLLTNNRTVLLSGLIQQGIVRTIAHITTSRGTPPRAYYYIAVHCKPREEVVKLKIANDEMDFTKKLYSMEITLIDYLYPSTGEDQLYELGTENADTLLERMANLVKANPELIEGTSRYRLSDPLSIRVEPEEIMWSEAERFHMAYLGTITFEYELC